MQEPQLTSSFAIIGALIDSWICKFFTHFRVEGFSECSVKRARNVYKMFANICPGSMCCGTVVLGVPDSHDARNPSVGSISSTDSKSIVSDGDLNQLSPRCCNATLNGNTNALSQIRATLRSRIALTRCPEIILKTRTQSLDPDRYLSSILVFIS